MLRQVAEEFEIVSRLVIVHETEGTCSRVVTAVESTMELEVVLEATAKANGRVKPKARSCR